MEDFPHRTPGRTDGPAYVGCRMLKVSVHVPLQNDTEKDSWTHLFPQTYGIYAGSSSLWKNSRYWTSDTYTSNKQEDTHIKMGPGAPSAMWRHVEQRRELSHENLKKQITWKLLCLMQKEKRKYPKHLRDDQELGKSWTTLFSWDHCIRTGGEAVLSNAYATTQRGKESEETEKCYKGRDKTPKTSYNEMETEFEIMFLNMFTKARSTRPKRSENFLFQEEESTETHADTQHNRPT